jgi:hypothetical protein
MGNVGGCEFYRVTKPAQKRSPAARTTDLEQYEGRPAVYLAIKYWTGDSAATSTPSTKQSLPNQPTKRRNIPPRVKFVDDNRMVLIVGCALSPDI